MVKSELLKVPRQMLQKYTPETMEVTQAIAFGLTELIPVDIHIGITGLPCPGGSETLEKPVGTMFIFTILHHQTLLAERIIFLGTQETKL